MSLEIYRAVALHEVEGRTLQGRALRFNEPTWVSDGGASYRESYSPKAFTKTLSERQSNGRAFPLALMHPYQKDAKTSPIPIGAVRFEATQDELLFTAVLADTVAGNEARELVSIGAMDSVSVGYRSISTRDMRDADGPYRLRSEVALIELSLVPSGHNALPGAQVLALRSDLTPPVRKRSALLLPLD